MIYVNFASPSLPPGFKYFGVVHMRSNVVASKTQDSCVEDTERLGARFADLDLMLCFRVMRPRRSYLTSLIWFPHRRHVIGDDLIASYKES